MDVRVTLKPGQKGTRRLATRYGDRLVRVRYRYDKVKRKRYKTIELIVDEETWIDGLRMRPAKHPIQRPSDRCWSEYTIAKLSSERRSKRPAANGNRKKGFGSSLTRR
ncbi:MAG: hypothetical protein ACREXY_11365 [Gammaproteobacteria bacterium]